jgi:hypothetical protein
MRLIATVGANKLKHEHTYFLNKSSYTHTVSFLALAEALKITDIVLIGTQQSEESLQPLLEKNPNIKMVKIDSDETATVFQKSLDHITKDTILDLTQGYRHYPMLTLLASVFLQNKPDKNIKNIYYAQILDNSCKPHQDKCKYRFVSLIHFLDIANMAKIINTFTNTLIVPDYKVVDKSFIDLIQSMEELSKALFSNNFQSSKEAAQHTRSIILEIVSKNELSFLEEHLRNLDIELKKIQNLTREKESLTLLSVSEYFLDKDILLHAITVLYESMVAFLDEKLNIKSCNTYIDKNGNKKKADIYKRRNCLKKQLGNCRHIRNIHNCKEFSKALRQVDKLRNISAHAFTTETHNKDLEAEISKYIKIAKQTFAF